MEHGVGEVRYIFSAFGGEMMVAWPEMVVLELKGEMEPFHSREI